MKALVVGGGGREHATAWKIAQSPDVEVVYCAPGNAGTDLMEKGRNVPISAGNIEDLRDFAKKEKIDLAVIGPEAPLVNGIVDVFEAAGIPTFGPNKNAAILEGSKVFSTELAEKYRIPAAFPYRIANRNGENGYLNFAEAVEYIHKNWGRPHKFVIKADGLASGKGVLVPDTKEEAYNGLIREIIEKEFDTAGETVLIQRRLYGWEVSYIVITDGKTFYSLIPGQDYKPIFDGNEGPNTGGMGGLFPLDALTQEMAMEIEDKIVRPTIEAMKSEGRPFKGALYEGVMVTEDGPEKLEDNERFGDPEQQHQMFMLAPDINIVPYLIACINGNLSSLQPFRWRPGYCVGVVAASKGYPGSPEKGKIIAGLDSLKELEPNVMVYHAGTKKDGDKIITDGGRVLLVAAYGTTQEAARELAYEGMRRINFDGMYFRTDIGLFLPARK